MLQVFSVRELQRRGEVQLNAPAPVVVKKVRDIRMRMMRKSEEYRRECRSI